MVAGQGASPAVRNHREANVLEYAQAMPGVEGSLPLLEERMRKLQDC